MRALGRFVFRAMVALCFIVVVTIVAVIAWTYQHYAQAIPLPEPQQLIAASAEGRFCSSEIEQRQFVSLEDIPTIVRAAFLTQDPDFFQRAPINPFLEWFRAGVLEVRPRGSVITEGVVRCLMSMKDWRAIDWHLGGGVLFWRVEHMLPRELILTLYLNEVSTGAPFGGVTAAATHYFGKPLADIEIDEAATLVVLSRSPSVVRRRADVGTEWRNRVIDGMLESGAIRLEQAVVAKERSLRLSEASRRS